MAKFSIHELDELALRIEERTGTGDLVALLCRANQRDELESFLGSLRLEGLLERDDGYGADLKILVIGESQVSEGVIASVARKEGFDPDRLQFCLGYDEAKRFPFYTIKPGKFRAVIFGPMPHSSNGKGDAGSTIANFERRQSEGVLVVRATDGSGALKLTKGSVQRAFRELSARFAA